MADIDLRVPVFDFDTGEFVIGLDGTVKTVTGSEAVGMIAVKAEETERGVLRNTWTLKHMRGTDTVRRLVVL